MSERCICKPNEGEPRERLFGEHRIILMAGQLPPVLVDPVAILVESVRVFGVMPRPKCAACGLRRGPT